MTIGQALFKWRGELAVPFLALAIVLGRPVLWTFVAGLGLTVAGEALRLSALRHIGPKSRRTGRTGSHGVVRSGPYGWTRNPLYLANILMVAGLLLALNQPVVLAAGVPLVALHYRTIIGAEEQALSTEFGEDYRAYLKDVPRLIPRPPRIRGGRALYRLRDVILPELNTVVSFEFAFALTGALAIWQHLP